MKYRTFGRTGLEVSELVFGGGYVGGALILADDDTKRAMVRRALEAGINWIDTAAMYGQGRSEEALGWLLKEVETQPRLSTKVLLDTARLDDIPGQIEAGVAASFRRLKRDSVDLLFLHNQIEAEAQGEAVGVDDVLRAGGAADGLERMREQGLTRFIGVTAVGDGAACRAVIDSGRFDAAQVYYNMINPSAAWDRPAAWACHDFTGLMAACKAQGTAVMAIRVLAAGVLATDQRHGREIVMMADAAIPAEEARARRALAALGIDAQGQTPYGTRAQTAVRFALANAHLACAVIGLAGPDQLEQALGAADLGPLPADALAKLEALYAEG